MSERVYASVHVCTLRSRLHAWGERVRFEIPVAVDGRLWLNVSFEVAVVAVAVPVAVERGRPGDSIER